MLRVGKSTTHECSCSALKTDLAGANLTVCMDRTSVLPSVGRDFSCSVGLGKSPPTQGLFSISVCPTARFNTERRQKIQLFRRV